jgi:hypothetical protein
VLLAPLLLVDVPPLLDYPNHLARLVVLSHPADPVLSRFYAPHWAVIPDLGIDALGVALLHVLPVSVAGRLLIAAALLLEVLGAAAYARTVAGRSGWALGVGLTAWNATLLLGFLNFIASLGLALLLAAAWLRGRELRPLRSLAWAIPGAVVLFFCHLMGLLLFALLIGAHEAASLRRPWLRNALRRTAMLVAVGAVPAALYLSSDLRGMAGEAVYLPPAAKAAQLLVPFVNYLRPLDVLTAGAVLAFLAACAATGRLRVSPTAGIALLLVAGLYAVAPFGFKGTYNLDTRFAIILGLLLFAAVRPERLPRWAARGAALGFAGLFLARMAVLSLAWAGHASDLAQLRAAIAPVPAGARVLLTVVSPAEAPDAWRAAPLARRLSDGAVTDTHIPALLVIERHAWWPFLFDNASQQPIRTRQPYAALAERVGGVRAHRALTAADLCGFDDLLLLDADTDPGWTGAPLPLTPLRRTGYAALFAIGPDPLCSLPQTGERSP